MEDLGEGPSLEDFSDRADPAPRSGPETRCWPSRASRARFMRGRASTRASSTAAATRSRRGPVTPLRAAADSLRAAPAALRAWLDATGAAAATGLEAAVGGTGARRRGAGRLGHAHPWRHGAQQQSLAPPTAGGCWTSSTRACATRSTTRCSGRSSARSRSRSSSARITPIARRMAGAFPAARDDGEYAPRAGARWPRGGRSTCCDGSPPRLLARDHDWAPGLTARRAVLWHLERFLAVAEGGAPPLAPIAATLERLFRRLSRALGRRAPARAHLARVRRSAMIQP